MNDIKILGFSGKKQSGKNTSANYILGLFLEALEICKEFKITPKGELWVSDIFGNNEYAGILDLNKNSIATRSFAEEHIYPFIKTYSFADLLKQKVCIDILGIHYDSCFGTDEQKNRLTHLYWEDMPGVVTECLPDVDEDDPEEITGRLGPYYTILKDKSIYHKPGRMTGREVMQFVGTEIFRKMYYNVWVDATIRKIRDDSPSMAIITDVRFPNEVDGILAAYENISEYMDGRVIRLTRQVNNDAHKSETALDEYDKSKYSAIIENNDMSIQKQNEEVYKILSDWKWIPHHIPEEIIKRLPIE